MNKSYKTLWSVALGAWVAVPETKKARGKKSKAGLNRGLTRAGVGGVAIALTLSSIPQAAHTACVVRSGGQLVATSKGDICVHNGDINIIIDGKTATQNPATGIIANSNESEIRIEGAGNVKISTGTLDSTTPSSNGISANSGSLVDIAGHLEINAAGKGVEALNSSKIQVNSASIELVGNNSFQPAITINSNSSFESKQGVIINDRNTNNVFFAGAVAIDVAGGGTLNVGGGLEVNSRPVAMQVTGNKSTVNMGSGKFSVSRDAAAALIVSSGGLIYSKGELFIEGSGLNNKGVIVGTDGAMKVDGHLGITLHGEGAQVSGDLEINTASINLTGGTKNSAGLRTIQNGSITSKGDVSIKLEPINGASAANIYGILAQTGSTIEINGNYSSVTSGSGISANNKNTKVYVGSGDITVFSTNTSALRVDDEANISSSGGVALVGTAAGAINGIYATNKGTINIDGLVKTEVTGKGIWSTGDQTSVKIGSLEVVGKNDAGVLAESGSQIVVDNFVKVTTQGPAAVGVHSTGVGSTNKNSSIIQFSGSGSVSTQGVGSDAVRVGSGGRFIAGDVDLRTSGELASGLTVSKLSGMATTNNPDVELESAIIRTSGENADGLQIGALSTAGVMGYVKVGSSLDIETTGLANTRGSAPCRVGAAICVAGDGSYLDGSTMNGNSRVISSGYALQMDTGINVKVELNKTFLSTTGDFSVIEVHGTQHGSINGQAGFTQLKLENSLAEAGSSGLLMNVEGNASLNFHAANTSLVGNVLAASGNELEMRLFNNSNLTGYIEGAKKISFDSSSGWKVTGNSLVQDEINNAGVIEFSTPNSSASGSFKTITVKNYVGQNGWLNINTYLGGDLSPTDKLIIDGGSATGQTTLHVANYDGLGALTIDKGIPVVEVINGATTGLDAFYLNGGVVPGGAYDYTLERNADNGWYLVSKMRSDDPRPVIRPELSLYSVVPSLAVLQGAAVLDTFHERRGGAQGVRNNMPPEGPLWIRMVRHQGTRKSRSVQSIEGNNFKHYTNGVQIGFDLLHKHKFEGWTNDAGLFLAYADSNADVKYVDGSKAGSNDLNGRSVGAYWSGYLDNGAYVDLVGMYTNHTLRSNSMRMLNLSTKGQSTALSIEGGIPFSVNEYWVVEPQVQLRMQRGHLDGTDDKAGIVDFGRIDSLQSRLGVRVAHRSDNGTYWGRLDWLQEMKGKSSTSLSAMSGQHTVSSPSSLHGAALAFSAGIDKQVKPNIYVYGSGGYQHRFRGRGNGYSVSAGIKIEW